MANLNSQYQFRTALVDALQKDLIGPATGADELIGEKPLDRYVMGVLWPLDAPTTESTDIEDETSNAGASELGSYEDTPVAQSRMRYPSSAGLTFSVDPAKSSVVQLKVSAGRYVPAGQSAPEEKRTRARGGGSRTDWQREAPDFPVVTVDTAEAGVKRHSLVPDSLELYVLTRVPQDGTVTITAVLLNLGVAKAGDRDDKAWFQVGIEATTNAPALADRSRFGAGLDDLDLASAALLYRKVRNFGIGHGCSVVWEPTNKAWTSRISTDFLPQSELHRAKADAADSGANLDLEFLSTASNEDIGSSLLMLVEDYRRWIAAQLIEIPAVETELQDTARRHLTEAAGAADRIEAGIRLLINDSYSMDAFKLANGAMLIQRNRQDWIRSGAEGVAPTTTQSWRPFQIAFVLINLPALADRSHPDRSLADLLWFPTGGGKTEAYLGLIAFSLFRRRLINREVEGVAVIMRYTLRLLTIQQFERAAMLMCSLETVRKADVGRLGDKAFSIGLWVGQGATPNSLDDARRSLNKLERHEEVLESNPVQLTRCPWCNTILLANVNYRIERTPRRHLHIACRKPSCNFSSGLPVHVVDEDIYAELPELLIGTVDKFARMPWKEEVAGLFGHPAGNPPPDLIIQDELHLISGPLGSVVGLYEIAVDAACQSGDPDNPTRAKIIASTATIRRATDQVQAIFNRGVAQFPPPGLEPDNSYFAAVSTRDEAGTRLYIGAMAPGTSHATLMIRIYAALLQAAQDLPGSDTDRDPYWTLLGYFNSLRVLGGAYLQVEADVDDRLKVLAGRLKDGKQRKLRAPSELTSRVSSSEIPQRLKALENPYPSTKENKADDVVLATNMISVGLDVDRLGLMAVMGQPQSSSEYIQATSRVGRKFPGLVVTIYNAARSRDRSHYESFLPFHQALYRAVEATSATPFAARARDRALHAALVSAARLLIPGLRSNDGADNVGHNIAELKALAAKFVERAEATDPASGTKTADQLDKLIDVWVDTAALKPNLKYSAYHNPEASLLVEAGTTLDDEQDTFDTGEAPWATLSSMRDVDVESTLYQIPMGKKS